MRELYEDWQKPGFSVPDPLVIIFTFPGIYYVQRRNYDSLLYLEGLWETGLKINCYLRFMKDALRVSLVNTHSYPPRT